MSKLTVAILCAFLTGSSSSQTPPQKSPCPDIFLYQGVGENWYGGVITVPKPTYATESKIHITMSLATKLQTKYPGSIELAESDDDMLNSIHNGLPIRYFVNFPIFRPIPKITEISFNGAIICSGPPETFRKGVYAITTVSLDHTFIDGGYLITNKTIPKDEYIYNSDETLSNVQSNNNYHQFNEDQKLKPSLSTLQGPYSQFPISNNIPLTARPVDSGTFSNPGEFSDVNHVILNHGISQNRQQTESKSPPSREASVAADSTKFECGVSHFIDFRIVNGFRTSKGDWPWITAMYIRRVDLLSFHCSGTLISNRHIVTAAQCMYDPRTKSPFKVNNLLIRLGSFNLLDWVDENTRQMEMSKFVIHSDFNKKTLQYDIALQTLSNVVTFSDYIIPVCLWDTNDTADVDGRIGTVVGWGIDENGTRSEEPRKASIPLISREKCKANSEKLFQLVNNMTICAGGRDGFGPCNGDAGAGVYLDRDQKWYLRGLISLSLSNKNGICDLSDYVILTDLAQFLPWMQFHMT